MTVFETTRLTLRRLTTDDATFILELVNDPSWLRFIGDRGVRTLEDARAYLLKGPMASYERYGFGLFLVRRKEDGQSIGICGLLKRDVLPDVDIGFAFLPQFTRMGYAFEAASATLGYGRGALALKQIVAVTSPGNAASVRLLEKLGLKFEKMVRLTAEAPEISLYGVDLTGGS